MPVVGDVVASNSGISAVVVVDNMPSASTWRQLSGDLTDRTMTQSEVGESEGSNSPATGVAPGSTEAI
jgi:hypothetical protein